MVKIYLFVNKFGLRLKFPAIIVFSLVILSNSVFSQKSPASNDIMEVGVAHVDITPQGPIRLAGYGARTKKEATEIIHRLGAKALAFGTDAQKPSILISVDLVGIPGHIRKKLADILSQKAGIDPAHLLVSSTHTHGGPEVGNLLNILQYRGDHFSDSLLAVDHLIHISSYSEQLIVKLELVAMAALKDRRPGRVSWGQGEVGFAKNRRTPGGPVDTALPLMRVCDIEGNLRAVFVNYACHGTTLEGDTNQVHGDWMSEAQELIEANHPGAIAMVAIGCGADANPYPRGKMEHIVLHGQEISDQVDQLLEATLQPLTTPPVGRLKWVNLPFSHVPTIPQLIQQTEDQTVKGYYARLALERMARGQAIPHHLSYPVQTWTFGQELAMINLAGEVVVDYALRLKAELGAEHLWINAYSNDVPCYIASRRVIREGGYEAESSMYYYDKPSPFAEEVEDIVIEAVHELLPSSFKKIK